MMIDDEELRNLFKTASEEHLQKLEAGILQIEKGETNPAFFQDLLREAHSLKGDSRMLGVKTVETLTHEIEHFLGKINQAEIEPTKELCDRIWNALTALRQFVQEAITGEKPNITVFNALAALLGANTSPPPQPSPSEPKKPETPPQPKKTKTPPQIKQPQPEPQPEPQPPPPQIKKNPEYRIETIRVETKNLDCLMTQAGELIVTKSRFNHRLNEIENLVSLSEETARELLKARIVSNHNEDTIQKYQQIYQKTCDRLEQIGQHLNQLQNSIYEDTTRLEVISTQLEEGIRTLRLLPLSTVFQIFPRMVRELANQQKKEIELIIEGAHTQADKRIIEEIKDPLMHILRNAIDHGIETIEERQNNSKPIPAKIWLRAYQTPTNIIIEVQDDGRGLDLEKIKQQAIKRQLYTPEEIQSMTPNQIQSLIFVPGFSTRSVVTEVSGRGIGLDVVRTNVDRLKGNIQIQSEPENGCTIRLQLSKTLATSHVLIVQVDQHSYAIPVEYVQTTIILHSEEIFNIEDKETVIFEGQPISIARLNQLLELPTTNPFTEQPNYFCIIIKVAQSKLGLIVDALIDEQDVVIKSMSQIIKRVRNVAGSTILSTGEVCIILHPPDLVKSIQRNSTAITLPTIHSETKATQITPTKPTILLVEDSITIRTQEKRFLENAGYQVVIAVDGLDGYNKLNTAKFDAIISDVEMPNLDGLSLVKKIRQHSEYKEIPIILVTSLASDEDKKRGAQAGANAYITKNLLNQDLLISTLKRLV